MNQACPCAPLDIACRKERCFCKGPNDLLCRPPQNQACSDKFGEGLVCRASGIGRCTGDEQCSGLKKCRRNDFMQGTQAPNNYCSLPKICRVRYARELSHLMEKYYEKTRHYTPKTAPGKLFTDICNFCKYLQCKDSEKQVGKCIVPKPLRQNKKFNYVWQNGIHCRNNVYLCAMITQHVRGTKL